MKRVFPVMMSVLVAGILQRGLAPQLSIGGIVPNFHLLVVVTLALATGPNEGAAAGFFAGLLFDLLGTGPIGLMALVLALTGYCAWLPHDAMFAEGWLLPVSVVFLASLTAEVSYALVLGFLGLGGPFFRTFAQIMLPGAVYNTALALLVYPWLARLLRQEKPVKQFRRLA